MCEEVMIPLFSFDTQTGKIDIIKENGFFDGNIVYCVKKEIGAASPEINLYKEEYNKVIDSGKMVGNIEKIDTEKLYAMLLYVDDLLQDKNLVNYDKWNQVFQELENIFKKRKKLF